MMKVAALALVALAAAAGSVSGQCTTSARTQRQSPTNPGISAGAMTAAVNGRTPEERGCSEVVTPDLQDGAWNAPWPRTNCPHLAAGLQPFESVFPVGSLSAGSNVVITSGQRLLLRPCSLSGDGSLNPSTILNQIEIQNGGELVFDDQDITLHVRDIFVHEGGALRIGSDTCRLYSDIGIMFHGTRASSSTTNLNAGAGVTKGLQAQGTLEMHGEKFHPTWTRLSLTANAGDNIIFVQDPVDWAVGMEILITTTVWYDCPSNYQSAWCDNNAHQNERHTITAIQLDSANGLYAVQISGTLQYGHYAGSEYQAEVALLTRRIHVWGEDSGDGFGAHMLVNGAASTAHWEGVQVTNGGQKNVEGRYPFHMHLLGNGGASSYVKDCSIVDSNFRCAVVHQTDDTVLERNVAYNVEGMCYYLEDGVEERNTLMHNLAAHIHPISRPADGGYGQGGETFNGNNPSELFLPADASAAGFYIPNAYNRFIGNAASGGWVGFAFPNTPMPIGAARFTDPGEGFRPENRPTLEFRANSAHSTGFYWRGHGSALYVGADLFYGDSNPSTTLTYVSGRNARDTREATGSPPNTAWMLFTDTKLFLTRVGLAHWGNQVEMRNFEIHDFQDRGAMVFGEAQLQDGLFVGRSGNAAGVAQQGDRRQGFQFYDTWVKIILDRVTFRNFLGNDRAVRFMDHSDEFLPQGINSVRGLRFENVDHARILNIAQCGADCGGTETLGTSSQPTMSSKIYSIWDWDGSLVQTPGTPALLGSNRAWWNAGNDCVRDTDWSMWHCPWTTNRHIAYIMPRIDAPIMYGCQGTYGGCGGQRAYYHVGRMTLWGDASKSIGLSPWAGVTGPANNGWHLRFETENTNVQHAGAPSAWRIGGQFQIPRGNFIVVSMKYPSAAQLQVQLEYEYSSPNSVFTMPMSTLAEVTQKTENLGPAASMTGGRYAGGQWFDQRQNFGGNAVGPAWHLASDGTLYLRVVNPTCYQVSAAQFCEDGGQDFTRDATSVFGQYGGYQYRVQVQSCPGCSVQSTRDGITYYQVTDQLPGAFNPTVGSTPSETVTQLNTRSSCGVGNPPPNPTTTTQAATTTTTTGMMCTPLTSCPNPSTMCGVHDNGCMTGQIDCMGCANPQHQCINGNCTCVPRTCASVGATCGFIQDLCGNTLDCGPEDCSGQAVPSSCSLDNRCIPDGCTPATTCSSAGWTCGPLQTTCTENGNSLNFTCGACTNQQESCSLTAPHTCSCQPLPAAVACATVQCGRVWDGCSQTIDCGTNACASENSVCNGAGVCVTVSCQPGEVFRAGACACDEENGFTLGSDGTCQGGVNSATGLTASLFAALLAVLALAF